jgi:ribonuclease P protein component
VHRLKTRNQFQAVLAGNKLVSGTRFAIHHLATDTPSFRLAIGHPEAMHMRSSIPCTELWLGAMIPKRWAKRAVTRNAIKRQIYSVARDFESQLPSGAWIVRLRSGFDKSQFHSASSTVLKDVVRSELVALLTRVAQASSPKPLQGLAK